MLLAAGGALAIGTVPLVRVLGPALRGGGDLAALVLSLMALLPAAAVLSAVTPAVAKLQLDDLEATGSVVGGCRRGRRRARWPGRSRPAS